MAHQPLARALATVHESHALDAAMARVLDSGCFRSLTKIAVAESEPEWGSQTDIWPARP